MDNKKENNSHPIETNWIVDTSYYSHSTIEEVEGEKGGYGYTINEVGKERGYTINEAGKM